MLPPATNALAASQPADSSQAQNQSQSTPSLDGLRTDKVVVQRATPVQMNDTTQKNQSRDYVCSWFQALPSDDAQKLVLRDTGGGQSKNCSTVYADLAIRLPPEPEDASLLASLQGGDAIVVISYASNATQAVTTDSSSSQPATSSPVVANCSAVPSWL